MDALRDKFFGKPNEVGKLVRKNSVLSPEKHQFTQFGTNFKRGTFITKLE